MKNVTTLERVQRRDTKFILQDYSFDYIKKQTSLFLLVLMYWFELHDILFLVASQKNPSVNFSILDCVSFNNIGTRSTPSRKLKTNPARLSATRHFYFNRVACHSCEA